MLLRHDHSVPTELPTGVATPCVFVVDDDDATRRFLASLFRAVGWRTETFTSAQEFLARPLAPVASCLVTEVALPEVDGLQLQELLAAGGHAMPIVFVTRCDDVPTTVRAMKAGAVDFIPKPADVRALLTAVAKAIEASRAMLQQRERMRELQARYESLTPRERDVLAGVVRGRLNKQIAGDLEISEVTVKKHRGRIMRKMNAGSLAALIDTCLRTSIGAKPALVASSTLDPNFR